MKEVHNNGVALDVEILNHYLRVSLKLIDTFLGDIRDHEYLTRKESLNKFLENPSLEVEGQDNVNLIDLQNFLQCVRGQNSDQHEAVLASLKQHFQPQFQAYFSGLPESLIETKILSKLVKRDQISLARTDRRNLGIFADFFSKEMAPQLLLNVVQGNIDGAEQLILKMQTLKQLAIRYQAVSLQHASVTDYSLRHFPAFRFNPNSEIQAHHNPNASPLKLARWIRDWYLEEILLMNLPQELRAQALKQIQAVKLAGIDYGYDLLLDGEVTQKMCDEQGAAVLDGRTSVILRGCELVMLSLSENDNIEKVVAYLREVSAEHDEQPILIKQGEKIYLYGFSNQCEKFDRDWCLKEMQHPGFSGLDFPKESKTPERKYLPLRKASGTLTESMRAEIVKSHGEIAFPYSCVLISIAGDEKLKKKDLDRILAENPNQPILLKQESAIFLYEYKFGSDQWMPTKLNDPGFQNLAFPKEGYCSLKLPPRKTNETLTQEMRGEMSTAHNFVDYRVQCREVVKTAHGIKTQAHVQVLGERRFDYHPLIEALKDYIEVRTLWENAGYPEGHLEEAVNHQWNRVAGLAEHYATAFLAQQYCHPKRSFENVKFDEAEFRGKERCLEFYDYVHGKKVFWFLRDSGLGSDFGIIRAGRCAEVNAGAAGARCDGLLPALRCGAAHDLRAVETLCEVSYKKLANVEKEFLDVALAPSNSHG